VILFVVPGVIAVVTSLAAALLHRRLRPAVAVPVLTMLSMMSALAVLWSLALLVVGFVGHIAWISERASWCRTLAHAHDAIPPVAGVAAIAALAASASSIVRHERRRPRFDTAIYGDHELVVLPDDEPTAYALPGQSGGPGHIVVSVGMIRALGESERRVLLAHERAHLRHGHHRYLRVADLVAAAVPLLRPISDRVRFATERWADEVASDMVGDRALTARAIARAALATTTSGASPALAMAALGVPARVDALLDDQPARLRRMTVPSLVALATVAASTVQLHHLLAFASRLCIA
jgi:hypothetical protein